LPGRPLELLRHLPCQPLHAEGGSALLTRGDLSYALKE
jgi:hypothetical protein